MKLIKIFCLCAFLLVPSISGAHIITFDSLYGGSGDVENVLFNEPGLLDTGLIVEGITNQSGLIVKFTGEEDLTTPANGQARIEAEDEFFDWLEIEMDDGSGFSKIQFNLDSASDDVMVMLSFWDDPDSIDPIVEDVYNLDDSGENFFTAIALDNQEIFRASIGIIYQNGLDTEEPLTDIQQIRLNPTNGVSAVPEPAAMLLLGGGLICFAVVGRKKFFKK